jgi:hypothetical protein
MLELLETPTLTPPFVSTATPEMSVHERCLLAAQSVIRSLALSGIDDASVVVRKLPWSREFTQGELPFPGIILSPLERETMDHWRGTNLRDDVGYPVQVSIVDRGNQDLQTNLGRMLIWRQRIARAFRNQRLTDVEEIMTCVVEPHHIYLPEAFDKGVDQSTLTLRFMSREPRGT